MWATIAAIAMLLLALIALLRAVRVFRALEKNVQSMLGSQSLQRQSDEERLARLHAVIESVRVDVVPIRPLRKRRSF